VTAVSHASLLSKIKKEKEIKLETLDKRKEKLLVSKAFHNNEVDMLLTCSLTLSI